MVAMEQLLEAIQRNDVGAVRALLEIDPGAANAHGPGGESPLLAALYRNADAIVDVLAQRRSLDLFEAAAVGAAPRVEELLRQDPAAVDARSADGWTALHLAAFYARRDVAELLLDRSASVAASSANYMANTPLHAAIAGKEEMAIVALLVERGADVNARAALGYTPLHIAASRGNRDIVELLLRTGASPVARTEDGKTPALIAAEHGHEAVAERLRGAERARAD